MWSSGLSLGQPGAYIQILAVALTEELLGAW